MTLTEFLLARIAEDEGQARKAIAMREAVNYLTPPDLPDLDFQAWPDLSVPAVVVGPERVLAECEAKRRIVELAEQFGAWEGSMAEAALLHLAAVYADHPDYRDEWRP